MGASFCYEAQGWGCCRIVGDGNTVRFSPAGWWFPDAAVTETRPSPAEWEVFWALVESVGPWSWQGDYGKDIMCGTPWSLKIEWDGKVMCCRGNAAGDDCEPAGFAQLGPAIMALARSH